MLKWLLAAIALVLPAAGLAAQERPPVEHFGAPELRGQRLPFSNAVRVGDVLYLSGQIGVRADGTLPEGMAAQARQTMDNIGAILRSASAGWGDVFHCMVMLDDMADWPAFNPIYAGYFQPDRMPARSALGADGLALGALVEVECQAHAPAPAPAAAPAGAAALLAQMRAACGGDAWDRVEGWSETGRVDLPGRPGVPYEAFHTMRAPTMLTRNRIEGRIVRQSGYDGRVGWQAGPDGQARIERDPAALRRMRRDAYLSSFGWFLPSRMPAAFALAGVETRAGRTFDVLRITPEGADSFDLWVDRATRRMARIVAGREYAELSDYREFAGLCTPTTGRQGDGDPAHEIVLHVEAVATGPVDAAIFAPPASGDPQ